MIATIRETDIAAHRVYGGGRRPSRRDVEFRVDPAELAYYTRRVRSAVLANRERPRLEARVDARRAFADRLEDEAAAARRVEGVR